MAEITEGVYFPGADGPLIHNKAHQSCIYVENMCVVPFTQNGDCAD